MLHFGKWHWTEAGIQAQENIPLYTCKEKKFSIEINNFCLKKWKDEFKTHFILPKFVSKILKFFHTVVEGALISSFDRKAKM